MASKAPAAPKDLAAALAPHLSADELAAVTARAREERARLPKIALLGKAGAGKTSTVIPRSVAVDLFLCEWVMSTVA